MMYTLDLTGHDDEGKPGVDRIGGRFLSAKEAEKHGALLVAHQPHRFAFKPSTLWVRDEENEVVRRVAVSMIGEPPSAYAVEIAPTDGRPKVFGVSGANDQTALIYAGKVVEANAGKGDPQARVTITRNGKPIGPAIAAADLTRRAV